MSAAGVAVDRGALLSQPDYNHAVDEEYSRLRGLAESSYQKRKEYSKQSQQAYKRGDHDEARRYSEKAKAELQVAEKYNAEAAEYVFVSNNADSSSNEIDLHGLYVTEAKWILQRRIGIAVRNGEQNLEVVVGKGLHSKNGISKIKPAVEQLCAEAQLKCYYHKKNTGVLIIELVNARVPDFWATIDYKTFLANSKTQNWNHYQQQNAPQYQQHAPQHQQQQQANGSGGKLLASLFGLLCICIKKNL